MNGVFRAPANVVGQIAHDGACQRGHALRCAAALRGGPVRGPPYALVVRGFLIVLAAVLVAVGIGIGAEGVAGPQVYGPPGARFTAAFPTAPSVTPIVFHGLLGGAGELYHAQRGEDALTVRGSPSFPGGQPRSRSRPTALA